MWIYEMGLCYPALNVERWDTDRGMKKQSVYGGTGTASFTRPMYTVGDLV